MVVFICDGCSATLKKNQVDAHAAKCYKCVSVCCVDCNVSFFGDDYRMHTSCITESEKYEGQFGKKKNKHKRNPQDEWMDIVTTCGTSASLPSSMHGYFATMGLLDNIPRKEKQFRNFTANSLKLRGHQTAIVDEIWTILNTEREKRQALKKQQQEKLDAQKQQEQEEAQTQNEQHEPKTDATTTTTATATMDPKRIKKAIKKTLKQAPNKAMKLKALRKMVGTAANLTKAEQKRLKKWFQTQDPVLGFKQNGGGKLRIEGKIVTLVE